jgi:hypothetical protein
VTSHAGEAQEIADSTTTITTRIRTWLVLIRFSHSWRTVVSGRN